MKKVNVYDSVGNIGWTFISGQYGIPDDPTDWIAARVAENAWGQPGTYTVEVLDWSQAQEDARINLEARGKAVADFLNNHEAIAKILRATAIVMINEVNLIRGWFMSFKTEVNAATSLADLKTRIASLPDMPDRTGEQLKTAIQNTIESGDAD